MAKSSRPKGPSARGAKTPPSQPSPGGPHLDLPSVETAEAILGTARAAEVPIGLDVPADAAGTPENASPAVITIGNRTFRAAPQRLDDRVLDVLPDLPDIRDRIYQPHLRALHPAIYPALAFPIRDQEASSRCTGYALAHVVDCLLHRETLTESARRVSARMLYEMARRNDEWAGTAYDGSSVRGALSGFYRNGVCGEEPEADAAPADWILTYERNKAARETRLGAYYRLQPDLADYHAALDEIGVIYASAQIHRNWSAPTDGRIEPGGSPAGGHAFAIVGYDAEGFWVLNSWGDKWGRGGVAHWLYEDWAATIMDAWVLQLGVRAPSAFSAIPRATPAGVATPKTAAAPNRSDIVGHFINIDDGRYVTGGRYGSPTELEMAETVRRLTDAGSNGGKGYDHLVIYAHGGLNRLDAEASRIAAWKQRDIFGRNGIYNFHLMWGSGFIDEVFGGLSTVEGARAAGWLGDLVFETGPGKALGSKAWRNMKQDASAAFTRSEEYDGGVVGLTPLFKHLDTAKRRPVLHLVGHSAGSIVLGRMLAAMTRFGLKTIELGSIHLMAPACTIRLFEECYEPYLDGTGAMTLKDKIYLYNLSADLERSDTVGGGGFAGYGASLLHLVSRAYEDTADAPLAGMALYEGKLPKSRKLSIDRSRSRATASTSHGGFDNDAATLTTIMSRILGRPVPKPPTAAELIGY